MEPLFHAIDMKLWGDLSPPVWVARKFSLETSSFSRDHRIRYELRCSTYHRVHPGSLRSSVFSASKRTSPQRTVETQGRCFVLAVDLSDRELHEVLPAHRGDLADVITTRLLRLASAVYVLDPRSGTRFEGSATPTPASPLFDPRLRPDESEDLVLGDGPVCFFCSSREPGFVWGNGTLMWVHAHCWGAVFGVVEEDK